MWPAGDAPLTALPIRPSPTVLPSNRVASRCFSLYLLITRCESVDTTKHLVTPSGTDRRVFQSRLARKMRDVFG